MIQGGKTVLLGMSGGTDSSVAAMLLKDQGYKVIGVTLLTWAAKDALPGLSEAQKLAASLEIPHHIIDCRSDFKEKVIQYFVDDYLRGYTPNPCIRCNETIKWKYLLNLADQLGCDYIATGHYVIKEQHNGLFYIRKGKDPAKDQSYFLWNLDQQVLSRALFPLGHYHKTEVKELAGQFGYANLGKKRETMSICFLNNTNYRDFLKEWLPADHPALAPGPVKDRQGSVIGRHEGYPFYTIGQKRGIEGIPGGQCVVKIYPEDNALQVGPTQSINSPAIQLSHFMLTKDTTLWHQKELLIRVRGYDKVPGYNGTLSLSDAGLTVTFTQPVWALCSGQSIVFYFDDLIIGGGVVTGSRER